MAERVLTLEHISPVQFYGPNDQNLERIIKHFPKLKFIARGNALRMVGDEEELDEAETALWKVVNHVERFGSISEAGIDNFLRNESSQVEENKPADDVIVYGHNGLVVKALTANQKRMVVSHKLHDMIFAIGPAGSGKTYTAVALAVRALKNKEIKKIILTRPAVEAGENLGFLPGDLKEKLDPYLQPLYDALRDMIPPDKLRVLMENEVIQIAPLAFMRGRTLDNAFVILDEAQNATENQLKMFLTRMGRNAKFIITGDVTQIDLPKSQPSGLTQAIRILSQVDGIDFVFLEATDIVRHPLVKRIIHAYGDKTEGDKNQNKS